MAPQSYTTSIRVDRTPAEVFAAITDVRGWWSEEVEGRTDEAGAAFRFRGHDDSVGLEHLATIRVTELVPERRVVWTVVENWFNFAEDQSEWPGTEIRFELSGDGAGGTEVRFTHEGLLPAHECYAVCSPAWTYFIQESLPSLLTTGTGMPIRKDAEAPVL